MVLIPVRKLLVVLPVVAALAAPHDTAAQARPRVTVTPSAGYVILSPLVDHDPDLNVAIDPGFAPGDARDRTRLALDNTLVAGARIAVALGSRWSAYAEGAYGTTEFEYLRQDGFYRGDDLVIGMETGSRHDASILTLGLGVARRFPLAAATEVEVGAGGALNRLQLDRPDCTPGTPSTGFNSPCNPFFPNGFPWEEEYDIPSASGTLALRQRLAGRISLEGRAGYSVGRANTETFHTDYIEGDEDREIPEHRTVHVGQLSLGLNVGF